MKRQIYFIMLVSAYGSSTITMQLSVLPADDEVVKPHGIGDYFARHAESCDEESKEGVEEDILSLGSLHAIYAEAEQLASGRGVEQNEGKAQKYFEAIAQQEEDLVVSCLSNLWLALFCNPVLPEEKLDVETYLDKAAVLEQPIMMKVVTFMRKYKRGHESSAKFIDALHTAVKDNNIRILELLCAYGKGNKIFYKGMVRSTVSYLWNRNSHDYLHVPDERGRTTLHMAASYGHPQIIEFLLSAGASINQDDLYGMTALHCAVQDKQCDAVEMLLEKGADINAKTHELETPLHFAVEVNDCKMAALLLEHNPNLLLVTSDGSSVFHYAVRYASQQMVILLLTQEGKINCADISGRTPLHVVVVLHNPGLANFLIEKGADVHLKRKGDLTPLHDAAREGDYEMVKVLLQSSSSVNVLDGRGRPPILLAAQQGHRRVAELLASHGALQYDEGKKALTYLPELGRS